MTCPYCFKEIAVTMDFVPDDNVVWVQGFCDECGVMWVGELAALEFENVSGGDVN